ncbi:MAG: hypothetical protein O3C21_13605 [Verrucomicrobia bacterium]|nr:hypothetical protein [Verrucomicrobiota bacterium]
MNQIILIPTLMIWWTFTLPDSDSTVRLLAPATIELTETNVARVKGPSLAVTKTAENQYTLTAPGGWTFGATTNYPPKAVVPALFPDPANPPTLPVQ